MESRFRSVLVALAVLATWGLSGLVNAEEPQSAQADAGAAEDVEVIRVKAVNEEEADQGEDDREWAKPEKILDPKIVRRGVKESRIDRENFEIGVFSGIYSVEDFGTNTVEGARAAFFVTEGVFFEAAYGKTEAEQTSIEKIFPIELIAEEDRELTYYNLSVGYNLLPGETFIGNKWAFNSALYVIAGAGSTKFAGDSRYTVNFGIGYRFLATDWLAWHLDMRDHIFDIEVTGEDKTTHNLELHSGFTVFF